MEQLTDVELVQMTLKGQTRGLDELVRRYLNPLYRFVLRLCGDTTTAEDLVQDSFLKAWRKLGSFQQDRSFKTWLFTIARNTTFDYLKKKKSIPFSSLDEQPDEEAFVDQIEDDKPLVTELLERKVQTDIVEAGLAELPLPSRTVILLHDGEDMTFQEIADTTKESLNTVKSRYRRAIILLRKRLEGLLSP